MTHRDFLPRGGGWADDRFGFSPCKVRDLHRRSHRRRMLLYPRLSLLLKLTSLRNSFDTGSRARDGSLGVGVGCVRVSRLVPGYRRRGRRRERGLGLRYTRLSLWRRRPRRALQPVVRSDRTNVSFRGSLGRRLFYANVPLDLHLKLGVNRSSLWSLSSLGLLRGVWCLAARSSTSSRADPSLLGSFLGRRGSRVEALDLCVVHYLHVRTFTCV